MTLDFSIGLPQFIFLSLTAVGFCVHIVKWDQPKTGHLAVYGGWPTLFGNVCLIGLLGWGGFFG